MNAIPPFFRRCCGIFWILAVFLAMPPSSWAAQSGTVLREEVVMVLPFQIRGSEDSVKLEAELTRLIEQRLLSKGLAVMPQEETRRLIARRNVEQLDAASVRRLLAGSRANAALYGLYIQTGSSFSLDGRLVWAKSATAPKVIRVEQKSTENLLFAVEDLAARVNSEMRKDSVIARVEVRGVKVLDPDVVLLRINTRPGDPIDPAVLDRELKRIWDLGYFNDIVMELEQSGAGINLVYNVTEKPRLTKIIIENAEAVNSADIRVAMNTQVGSILNEKTLVADLQTINELYHKKGHYLARSTYRLEEQENGTANLIVHIEEGRQLFIKTIEIKGASAFSESSLKSEMALAERGFFSFITDSGILKEEMLERDVAALSVFYMNKGFLDVKINPPKVRYEEDGIVISYEITEGPPYRVESVGFDGELIDSDEALAAVTEMARSVREGAYFNLSVMQSDVRALTAYYSEYGYAFAAVHPQPQKNNDADNPSVRVVYAIEKQQKVYVRSVILEGNAHTRDNVILREMRLADGDVFNGQKLSRSMQRLNRLGYFEKAEAELIPTANPSEADIKVKLVERNTGAIMGGVGYSTYSKFGVTGSIQENNLWGKGYAIGAQALFASLRTAYDFSFVNPRLNDGKFSLSTNFYLWDDDYLDYRRKTTGGSMRIGYPLGEYSNISVGYRAEFYKLFDFASGVSRVLRDYEGNRVASVGSLVLWRDTTDDSKPADGTLIRLSGEYAGDYLGGDDSFIKLIADYHFYKLITENSVAHLRLRGGALLENESNNRPPVFERFWMGGIDSVRGYYSRDIVPRDPNYGDRIGGDRMVFANLEYIVQLNRELGLNLVPFFDAGLNFDQTQGYTWKDDQKKSAGVELRWRSPMGNLRFSWGYPFDKSWEGNKLTSRFEFSIGNFF